MAKPPRWKREQQELLNANAELWDLLGRDPFGTRVALTLIRNDIRTPSRLREALSLPGPKAGGDAFGGGVDMDDLRGIGPAAMAHIRERLGLAKAE
jgi:hypothetical protein